MKNKRIFEYFSFIAVAFSTAVLTISFMYKDLFESFFYNETNIIVIAAILASVYAGFISIYFSRMRERIIRKQRIFIIYNSKDKNIAAALVNKLRENGYNPWFDADEITPGQMWAKAINKGLSESSVAIYIHSENSTNEKSFVNDELEMALSTMKSKDDFFSPVIPIRLDDSDMPKQLASIHWVDLRDDNGFDKLQEGLNRILGRS